MFEAAIIGAGPAGLAAATLLREHGASVALLDEQAAPGGQIYRAVERAARSPALLAALGADYRHGAELVARFRASGCDYRPGSSVWQVTLGTPIELWSSRNGHSDLLRASNVILATGAMERAVPVPGWTLPGAMAAGAVQGLLKSSALLPQDIVLAGSGPLLYLLAVQCLDAGARVTALLDTSTTANWHAALRHLPAALRGAGLSYLRKGAALKSRLWRSGIPIHRGITDLRIDGGTAVTGVSFRSRGRPHSIATTLVALHEGVIPAQQMTRSLGCAHRWDAAQHCFRPETDAWGNASARGVLVAGDASGIAGARAAEHAGRIAGFEVLRRLGRIATATRDRLAGPDLRAHAAELTARPFLDQLYAPPPWVLRPDDDVIVCRCEEVTAGAVRGVVAQGCLGPNQAKSFLRAGMGPCQGRICGPLVAELLADARGVAVADVGYYRVRPPLKPVTVGELAALGDKPQGDANAHDA